ncbi:MAG: NmrA family NAD(P)-binding protein [Ralstonia sp.]|uniref:NmrA family NAD(P)-binding protein n=1 Tax=Ralstonia pickettii TaxID=329 RepID=A0A9Q2H4S9_RALPI|nr:NmrA family NAD(P)-binding protein [Ralstonia pickettii]MBA9847608.1 NAD-dependent epimerase/dehydratase family protein [Ralstonia pickettii]MBA9853171.1 NAD-dependent epimerase/dehydratase family protein [Ralstonia pickettii]MBA9879317.1 NAD-dependent epimerase/dehydratase family protein [Ralstonia pickettii]MBA9884512.1 NAD-dependent epimerase/dehydratase family protein [Ralstonia pickettii]MBA9889303.1 NAD-dependent epimerase/dehydratase family protein [Ralstonia pickettii]
MTILVTGATGRVGRQVVHQLANRGADVRALVRDPSKADFPASVNVVQGDMLDIESLRRAFVGVRTLFLLNAVAGDEFTQALLALNVARESGVERVVYLSVMHAERFVNVPHFAVKSGAERMIEQMGFSATILRPAYFMDNEHMVKDVIVNHGVYPMPIGSKGVAMVDTRDIAEVAAIELIRRDAAPGKLPIEIINLVGPDTLTGPELASIWSETLGRPVAYGGDDPTGFESNLTNFLPKWMAYEMRLMAERYVSDGMVPQAGDVERLTALLGRPLGSYRDFAAALAR